MCCFSGFFHLLFSQATDPAATSASVADSPSIPKSNASVNPTPSTQEPDLSGFAQTRPPDDLFGDDFTPLAEPVVEPASQFAQSSEGNEPSNLQATAPRRPSNHKPLAPRHLGAPKTSSKPANNDMISPTSPNDTTAVSSSKEIKHAAAVRGDRSATGGVAKPKLTEAELNAKMEAIKLKNTALEQAHARQKADEESFQASEAAAKQRQKQERVNRQAMLSEREKIAQRKMQAQSGRDWDASKDEADVVDRPHRRPMRGAHGGVAGFDRTQDVADSNRATFQENIVDDFGRGRGSSRGGRGRGRGAGRGGRGASRASGPNGQVQNIPTAQDFPALHTPGPKESPFKSSESRTQKLDTSVNENHPKTNRVDSLGAVLTPEEKKSWAEQMDDSMLNWQAGDSEPEAPKVGW